MVIQKDLNNYQQYQLNLLFNIIINLPNNFINSSYGPVISDVPVSAITLQPFGQNPES